MAAFAGVCSSFSFRRPSGTVHQGLKARHAREAPLECLSLDIEKIRMPLYQSMVQPSRLMEQTMSLMRISHHRLDRLLPEAHLHFIGLHTGCTLDSPRMNLSQTMPKMLTMLTCLRELKPLPARLRLILLIRNIYQVNFVPHCKLFLNNVYISSFLAYPWTCTHSAWRYAGR